MKKIYWAAPVIVLAISIAAYLYLGSLDVEPLSMVHDVKVEDIVEIPHVQAITTFENNFGELTENADGKIVIGEKRGSYIQYFTQGDAGAGADSLDGAGYNAGQYRRALANGWTYCVDYVKPITFSEHYVKQLKTALKDDPPTCPDGEIEMLIKDKIYCSPPADKAASQYVVQLRAATANGEVTAYFDAKTKDFIGFAE